MRLATPPTTLTTTTYKEAVMSATNSRKCQDCGMPRRDKRSKRCPSCAHIARRLADPFRRSPLRFAYQNMKSRCYYRKAPDYRRYGGRGITICEAWLKDFFSFRDWMLAAGWRRGLTIDRIDNNGSYSPENCRVATTKEQSRNKRTSRFLSAFGETKTIADWTEDSRCVVSKGTVLSRLRYGWRNNDKVLATPAMTREECGKQRITHTARR